MSDWLTLAEGLDVEVIFAQDVVCARRWIVRMERVPVSARSEKPGGNPDIRWLSASGKGCRG
jgi:hypothetical protein